MCSCLKIRLTKSMINFKVSGTFRRISRIAALDTVLEIEITGIPACLTSTHRDELELFSNLATWLEKLSHNY